MSVTEDGEMDRLCGVARKIRFIGRRGCSDTR
jgi:hypothetical protein